MGVKGNGVVSKSSGRQDSALEQCHLHYILLVRVSQRSEQHRGVRTGIQVGGEKPLHWHTGRRDRDHAC